MEKNDESMDILKLSKIDSVALVMGNELEWVSETAQKWADHICHLQMLGKKESLNVAVAAGIGMYHFLK